jgi:cytochrome c553
MKFPNILQSQFVGATTTRASLCASFPSKLAKLALAAACAVVAFPVLAADPPKGNIEAAKSKVSMCIGCHGIPGYRASFPEIYSVPKIAGQNEKYIQSSLRAYATGERTHPTMDAISKSLSDQDMADLAAYYSNLK